MPGRTQLGEERLSAHNLAWYAIRVRSRFERSVSEQLEQKGYEQFLPMYWSRRVWSDRVKVLQLPLFGGYLFCRFDVQKRLPVLQTPGVVNVVGKGKVPVPVDSVQLENIRAAVNSGQKVQPWPRLDLGESVRVEFGPLRGVEGTLLRYKNATQLILAIDLMQRAIAVEVKEDWVIPCRKAEAAAHDAVLVH
jgi:transcription termination/antitermination protein NusG